MLGMSATAGIEEGYSLSVLDPNNIYTIDIDVVKMSLVFRLKLLPFVHALSYMVML